MKPKSRLAEAFALACEAHDGQLRKGTEIPYISHPMAVAALVLEYGGTEDQAIAALLHDAIEDGGVAYASRIQEAFGPEVLAMVEACTDGTAESKANAQTMEAKKSDWHKRKEQYLQVIESESEAALLVTACDKLHNARAVVADLASIGQEVFDRFTTGREGTLWYYQQVAAVMQRRESPVAAALSETVENMKELARPQ